MDCIRQMPTDGESDNSGCFYVRFYHSVRWVTVCFLMVSVVLKNLHFCLFGGIENYVVLKRETVSLGYPFLCNVYGFKKTLYKSGRLRYIMTVKENSLL